MSKEETSLKEYSEVRDTVEELKKSRRPKVVEIQIYHDDESNGNVTIIAHCNGWIRDLEHHIRMRELTVLNMQRSHLVDADHRLKLSNHEFTIHHCHDIRHTVGQLPESDHSEVVKVQVFEGKKTIEQEVVVCHCNSWIHELEDHLRRRNISILNIRESRRRDADHRLKFRVH